MRLVLEDARVDECLRRLKDQDMVLVEMEEKIGRLEDAVRVWRIQCAQRHKEPPLPFDDHSKCCALTKTGTHSCEEEGKQK